MGETQNAERMTEIENRVVRVIAGVVADGNAAGITPELSLADDLGADGMDILDILMAAEQEFGIELPDDAECTTVADVIRCVKGAIE